MTTGVLITIFAGLLCVSFFLVYKKKGGLRIGIGLLGIIILIYAGYSYGVSQPNPYLETFNSGNKQEIKLPIDRIQVISPVDNDMVKCRILTMGVYPESHNRDIWVLLKPSDNKYYPQSDYTNTSYKRKGEWQVITRFGGDSGEVYDLIVYETDSLASNVFTETIATWKANNNYVGLEIEELPQGAKEVERITVTLEDNCRGAF